MPEALYHWNQAVMFMRIGDLEKMQFAIRDFCWCADLQFEDFSFE